MWRYQWRRADEHRQKGKNSQEFKIWKHTMAALNDNHNRLSLVHWRFHMMVFIGNVWLLVRNCKPLKGKKCMCVDLQIERTKSARFSFANYSSVPREESRKRSTCHFKTQQRKFTKTNKKTPIPDKRRPKWPTVQLEFNSSCECKNAKWRKGCKIKKDNGKVMKVFRLSAFHVFPVLESGKTAFLPHHHHSKKS